MNDARRPARHPIEEVVHVDARMVDVPGNGLKLYIAADGLVDFLTKCRDNIDRAQRATADAGTHAQLIVIEQQIGTVLSAIATAETEGDAPSV